MGIRHCDCCEQYDFYAGQNVRILAENIEDEWGLGLNGTRVFEVLEVGCDCIVVADIEPRLPGSRRRITISCRKITAIVGAPGSGNPPTGDLI